MKKYTALTQNMFRHLARGEEVQYQAFRVKAADEKVVVRGVLQDGREVELHYRLRPGNEAGFSKEQFKSIFAFREKPIFSVHIRSKRTSNAERMREEREGRRLMPRPSTWSKGA
jgi:hypothetical protein